MKLQFCPSAPLLHSCNLFVGGYRGAKVAGQREWGWACQQLGDPNFPPDFPDCHAAAELAHLQAAQHVRLFICVPVKHVASAFVPHTAFVLKTVLLVYILWSAAHLLFVASSMTSVVAVTAQKKRVSAKSTDTVRPYKTMKYKFSRIKSNC